MEVLILTTFVSVLLAAAGVGLFVWSVRARTFDHSDRLAILPLDEPPNLHAVATPRAPLATRSANPGVAALGALDPSPHVQNGPNSYGTEKQSS